MKELINYNEGRFGLIFTTLHTGSHLGISTFFSLFLMVANNGHICLLIKKNDPVSSTYYILPATAIILD